MKHLFLSVLCLSVFYTATGHTAPIDDARLKALAWLIQNKNGDGSFRSAPGLEVTQTTVAVERRSYQGRHLRQRCCLFAKLSSLQHRLFIQTDYRAL